MTANTVSQIGMAYTVYSGRTDTKTQKTSNSFENIMNDNIIKQSEDNIQKSVKTDVKKNSSGKGKDDVVRNDKPKDDKVSPKKKTDTKEEFEESVTKTGEAIVSLYTQDMNIPEEKLNEAMEALGVNILSLTEPDIAKEVVMLANNETDMLAALTNETFADNLEVLNNFFKDFNIEEQLGMSSEEFNSIVNEAILRLEQNEVPEESVIQSQAVIITDDTVDNDVSDDNLVKNNSINDLVSNDENTEVKSQINETTANDTESDGQNQRSDEEPSESSIVDVASFAARLEKSLTVKNGELYQETAYVSKMREVVNQIVEQIRITVKPDTTTMEMQLNPENLGKVNLHIVSKNGEISAQFIVESQTAKEAIESQLETLKDRFESQGIKVNAVEVSISDYDLARDGQNDSSKGYQQEQSQKGRRRYDSSDTENISEIKKEIEEEMLKQSGSSVDFSA